MVEMRGVSLRHREDNLALDDVSFSADDGEFVFIVGHTGSGKSSLLRLLNRELRATDGQVIVNGQDLSELHARDVPFLRRRVGVVYQDFRLLPDRTLAENVAFALRVIGVHGRGVMARTEEALERVGLAEKGRMFPSQVSGGEQQRAALARAIVNNPMLLIADEPTGNLDPQTSLDIMELLERVNLGGATVMVATHDHAMVDALCKRVIELDHGRLVRDEARGRYQESPPPVALGR